MVLTAKTTAFLFPGQGSQTVGMLNAFFAEQPLLNQIFEQVSDRLGYDLKRLVQEGPETQLNQTEYTQAAMLTADVALFRLLEQEIAIKPAAMAGHSLGEYAALVCAGALELTDAAVLVARRGRLMQETIPIGQGAMAAIVGLSNDQVEALCLEASQETEQVSPANYNAIGQLVVAGHHAAVARAISLAESQQARMAVLLPVSVPCHCALLKPASIAFQSYLEDIPFQAPEIPVISNVDLSLYQNPGQIRALLAAQLYSPVRWVDTLLALRARGIDVLVESGPGRVLTGLAKRVDRSFALYNLGDVACFAQAVTALKGIME